MRQFALWPMDNFEWCHPLEAECQNFYFGIVSRCLVEFSSDLAQTLIMT